MLIVRLVALELRQVGVEVCEIFVQPLDHNRLGVVSFNLLLGYQLLNISNKYKSVNESLNS